jgi:UDP-N-acetylmuramate dehydrogenase
MYGRFVRGKPLRELSTLEIGGPARYFIDVKEIASMQEILHFCHREEMNYVVVGKGSNCLFSDSGFDGLAIRNKIEFCHEIAPFRLYVGAGYSFSLLASQTAKRGLGGLEFGAGIPGSVGGSVYMNAAAQGFETQNALQSVDYITEEGKLVHLTKEELHFSYRTSSFHEMKGAIVAATFALVPSNEAPALQKELLDYRLKTQPYSEKSAGCMFRNPRGASAGALIDSCGLKGARVGGAEVSLMHANFLINRSAATCRDMLGLVDLVQTRVAEKTGFKLEPEVCVIDDRNTR